MKSAREYQKNFLIAEGASFFHKMKLSGKRIALGQFSEVNFLFLTATDYLVFGGKVI